MLLSTVGYTGTIIITTATKVMITVIRCCGFPLPGVKLACHVGERGTHASGSSLGLARAWPYFLWGVPPPSLLSPCLPPPFTLDWGPGSQERVTPPFPNICSINLLSADFWVLGDLGDFLIGLPSHQSELY